MGNGKMSAANALKTAVVLFLLALLCGGCPGGGPEGVETSVIEPVEYSKSVTGAGKVEALDPYYVNPVAGGPLTDIYVADGELVEAGQALASVDRAALEEEVREAESNYLTQSSMGDLFSSLFSDIQSMYGLVNSTFAMIDSYSSAFDSMAQGYSRELTSLIDELPPESRENVEQLASRINDEYARLSSMAPSTPRVSSSGYPGSASQADRARTELALSEYQDALNRLGNADITAPVAGNVFYVSAEGLFPEDLLSEIESGSGGLTSSIDFMSGGMEGLFDDLVVDIVLPQYELKVGSVVETDKPAFMIVSFDRMSLTVKVEELDISLVEEGQKAVVSIEALPGETFQGEVVHVSKRPSLTLSDSSLFEVEIEFDTRGEELRLGYSASAEIVVVDEESSMLIPLEALLLDPYPHVMVEQDGRAEARRVVPGTEDEDMVEILEGVGEGDRVVVKGANKVEEGDSL